jgi:hypothetical protein
MKRIGLAGLGRGPVRDGEGKGEAGEKHGPGKGSQAGKSLAFKNL